MDDLLRNLRLALRGLIRNPGFAAVTVLCLALGIGANTAVFSVINAVLLRDLPFDDPDRIVLIFGNTVDRSMTKQRHSGYEFLDFRERTRSLDGVSAFIPRPLNLTTRDQPERLTAARVSASLFSMLGLEAAHGRTFTEEEDRFGQNFVVLLSDELWRRRFGADPGVLGQTVSLDDKSYEIIGVLPPGFAVDATRYDLWIPIAINLESLPPRGMRGLSVVARLADGVSLEQAQAEMDLLEEQFAREDAELYSRGGGWELSVVPIAEELVGDLRPALILLLGAVALVLLIACTNVANLFLARATARAKEIALRSALGSGRGRIIRQLLTESTAIALTGGLLGLVLASWGVSTLAKLDPQYIPRLTEVTIDRTVLGFTLAVSIVTGLLFGLLPAIQASRPDLQSTLKEGGRSAAVGRTGHLLRSGLIVVQVAIAVIVLSGAALTLRSFSNLQRVDPGFEAEPVLAARLFLTPARYRQPHEMSTFVDSLLRRIGSIPGVETAAVNSSLPVPQYPTTVIRVQGDTGGDNLDETNVPVIWSRSTPDYFTTMGIPLLTGRTFNAADGPEGEPVAIIDQELAERYWPGESALDKRIRLAGLGPSAEWLRVVGVVGHVLAAGLEEAAHAQVYTPYDSRPVTTLSVVMRTRGNPQALAAPLRDAVRQIDAEQPVSDLRPMSDLVAASIAGERAFAFLMICFGTVALALVALGVYSVMAYAVTQRNQEFGIRMALGARRRQVLRGVLSRGLLLAGVGIAIGLAFAFTSSRLVSSLLFGVAATDVLTYAGVALLLLALASLATTVPAYRATRVDPAKALSYQ